MTKAERQARETEHREFMEKDRRETKFGNRITQGGRAEFFSVYTFPNQTELFHYLAIAREFECDVYFRNEDLVIPWKKVTKTLNDIYVETEINLKLVMYMFIRDADDMRGDFLRYQLSPDEEKDVE